MDDYEEDDEEHGERPQDRSDIREGRIQPRRGRRPLHRKVSEKGTEEMDRMSSEFRVQSSELPSPFLLSMRERAGVRVLIALCIFHFASLNSHALDLHGFLQGNYSARITDDGPPQENGSDYLLSEERFQLKLSETSKDGSASLFLRTDFFHDGVDEESDIVVREGFIDYTKGNLDMRLGRQIVTWGTG